MFVLLDITCINHNNQVLRKGIFIYCVCITTSQHKIGLTYSKKKKQLKEIGKKKEKLLEK